MARKGGGGAVKKPTPKELAKKIATAFMYVGLGFGLMLALVGVALIFGGAEGPEFFVGVALCFGSLGLTFVFAFGLAELEFEAEKARERRGRRANGLQV